MNFLTAVLVTSWGLTGIIPPRQGLTQTWARFFRWGGSDLRLGGIYPPQLPKSSPAASKKKKKKRSPVSPDKFFTTWKKLPYPPQPVLAGGMKVFGGGIYPPYPPTPMSGLTPARFCTTLPLGCQRRPNKKVRVPLCRFGRRPIIFESLNF